MDIFVFSVRGITDAHATKHREVTTTMVQFDCIERPLGRFFYVYGRFIARNPTWFIICPLLLAAALGSGFYNFQVEHNLENLFSPDGARSKDERSIMQALFNESDRADQFSPTRMTTMVE